MSTNSSSFINGSFQVNSPSNFFFPHFMYCFILRPSSFIFTAFIISYISFLLPLCTLILHQGCRCWQPSTSSAAAMSHSDNFTYNVVIMELIGVAGCIVSCCGIYTEDLRLLAVGLVPACFIMLGEGFFHVLTCVERYLAVVHPIIYLSLKSKQGIRIRNVGISCGWLLSVAGMGLLMSENLFIIIDSCLLVLAIIIVSFCSLSVLCVLIRPGPGEQSRDHEKVHQTKKKAFYTITTILGVLVLRFTVGLTRSVIYVWNKSHFCVIMCSGFFFYLPSSLLSPLLFLHRA